MKLIFISLCLILLLGQIFLIAYNHTHKPVERYYNLLNILFLLSLFPLFSVLDIPAIMKFILIVICIIWAVIYIILNIKAEEDYKDRQ